LGAARRRLAECSGQREAIEAVREIVSNFLGSEEMALFHADCQNAEFQTLWSFGIEPEKCNLFWALNEEGLERILRGECHVEAGADAGNGEKNVRAFVPIRVANDTVAVLAILQLLPQKAGFDKADLELLTLLSDQAGKALFHSGVHGHNRGSNEPEQRA
jgi:GAF domain